MKQYLLFACIPYEGSCGWNDFIGDYLSAQDAKQKLNYLMHDNVSNGLDKDCWWNIIDIKTGEIVASNHGQSN